MRLRVIVGVCCLALLAGWATKARCLTDGGWQGGEQYHAWCYTDVYPLWFAERLDERAVPYFDHPVEYPVLTGAQMWLVAQTVQPLPAQDRPVAFFHVTALLGALAVLATLLALWRDGVPPARLLWWAAAPTLVVYAFMNWDPVPVALLIAGILLHRRGQDAAAGAAAGLGAAAKLFPGLLVPVVVAARLAQGRRRDAATHAAAAGATWLAVNLPVLLGAREGWWRFFELNRERGADWDSLWFMAERIRGEPFSLPVLNLASAVVFLSGAAVIAWLGTRRRPPERWWELLLPLLAWFLLSNKVYSPQFSLWLLPLMALALPRWQPFAAFAIADLGVFLLRFPYLGGVAGFEPAPDYAWFAVALLLRAGALAWVIFASVRAGPDLYKPSSLVTSSPS